MPIPVNIFPRPLSILPRPSIGDANILRKSANLSAIFIPLLMKNIEAANVPPPSTPANTLPQSIPFTKSTALPANDFMAAHTLEAVSLIPIIKPSTKFMPAFLVSVEGE